MEEIIRYLTLKNQYYEKFCSISKRFLAKVQQNHWENLELFVDNRERILNIIRSYDFKIATCFESLDLTHVDLETYRNQVKNLLDRRAAIVKEIVTVDMELISKIDELKSETIRELKKTVEKSQIIDTFSNASTSTFMQKPAKTA